MKYSYTALDVEGGIVSDEYQCSNKKELKRYVMDLEYDLLTYKCLKQQNQFRISEQKQHEFLLQISFLLDSSFPILSALNAALISEKRKVFRQIHQIIINEIEAGNSFHQALSQAMKIDKEVSCLIKHGELSGRLNQSLNDSLDALNWKIEYKKLIVKNLFYPLINASLMAIMIGLLCFYMIPEMKQFYRSMMLKEPKILSMIDQLLLNIGSAYSFMFYVLLGVSIMFFKRHLIAALYSMPWIKNVLFNKEKSQFYKSLSTLYSAGTPILEAINISASNCHPSRQKQYVIASEIIKHGESIFHSFKKMKLLNDLESQSLQMAESAGKLEDFFIFVSNKNQNEFENTMNSIQKLIQPISILIVGGMLVMILLCFLIPLYDSLLGLGFS